MNLRQRRGKADDAEPLELSGVKGEYEQTRPSTYITEDLTLSVHFERNMIASACLFLML